ncbi:MAG: hypothetical protein AVDCRST_MAG42-398 [uncultured Chthoniobacterales bacterium]|uniref:Uncharacterized protein n=1 Tax=uncultured Chthoniobacterales bacterium TaxID=1836801 RepID=A0A6J4H817_9BACT|nr:MAG: hypothetical protein AVDCRST_MAG42-398 [uncultured Chthoniobacterales bacterium]
MKALPPRCARAAIEGAQQIYRLGQAQGARWPRFSELRLRRQRARRRLGAASGAGRRT